MKKIFTLIVMLAAVLGMQAQDTWTIAGDETLMGEGWKPASTVNVMTTTDNIHYTLVKENVMLKASTYYYKACQNGGWDVAIPQEGNNELAIAENGAYKITFTLDLSGENASLTADATKTGEYEGSLDATVVLAGATAIFGVSWDGASSDNTMTTTDGVHYTMQKTDITLEAFVNYEFKIVIDGQWNGNAGEGKFASKDAQGKDYPNIEITVEENGVYTINFSVDIEAKTFTVQTTKTGDAVIAEKTWTIAGSSALVFGKDHTWDPTYTENDMTKLEDGSFELVKHSITFDTPTTINFKVCANHSWDESYGDNGENMSYEIETAGTYDVIFTFIPDSKSLSAELGDPTPATGINTVKENNAKTAVIYNLQGQRVQEGYRGVAIQNGRKFMMK